MTSLSIAQYSKQYSTKQDSKQSSTKQVENNHRIIFNNGYSLDRDGTPKINNLSNKISQAKIASDNNTRKFQKQECDMCIIS